MLLFIVKNQIDCIINQYKEHFFIYKVFFKKKNLIIF